MVDESIRANGTLRFCVLDDEEGSPAVDNIFEIEAPGTEGYVLGRSDAGSSYVPDIDLAPFNAQRRGISRRHAAIVNYRGIVRVVDLGSMNGTFVNEEQLPPRAIQDLKSGDRISLANLEVEVTKIT
jgi:hypothetical protein